MPDFEFIKREHPRPSTRRGRRGEKRADKSYIVKADGVEIGIVEQRMATFETQTPGRMYVNRRWESPRWFIDRMPGVWIQGERLYRCFYETRKRAAEELYDTVVAAPARAAANG